MSVTIRGMTELRAKMAALPVEVEDAMRIEVRVGVKNIRDAAKQRVPRDSGDLMRSIRYRIRNDGLTGRVETKLFYGRFVEFGTVKMNARPWLFPSAEEERPKYRQRVAERVRETLRKVARK